MSLTATNRLNEPLMTVIALDATDEDLTLLHHRFQFQFFTYVEHLVAKSIAEHLTNLNVAKLVRDYGEQEDRRNVINNAYC